MSHLFTLTPNIPLLTQCGFLTYDMAQSLDRDVPIGGSIEVEYQPIWTEEKRIEADNRFTALVNTYNIAEHRDTILYVCLAEGNHADTIFQDIHDSYQHRLRDKQLAQFLMLYKPNARHQPINLKVSTVTETVKLTDVELIGWFGELVKQFLERGEFIPGRHGGSLYKFIIDEDGNVNTNNELNYKFIEALSKQTIRKPGVRDRNKVLASFLLKIWNVLNKGTSLTTSEGVRFSDSQLKFLFKVAEILGWLNALSIDSDPKDCVYSLLTNHITRK